MAVTMTAELADCFSTKREGVGFVLDAFRQAFPKCDIQVYGVDGLFRTPGDAVESSSPRWPPPTGWRAPRSSDARFRMRCSWTSGARQPTSFRLPAVRVAARGKTDPARLQAGELVYTGALRTPVCAVVRHLPLRGRTCRIAAEYFAIAADVHLWLKHIEETDYTCETPDGRGRSREEAAGRLARMVCADLEVVGPDDITAIADIHLDRTGTADWQCHASGDARPGLVDSDCGDPGGKGSVSRSGCRSCGATRVARPREHSWRHNRTSDAGGSGGLSAG